MPLTLTGRHRNSEREREPADLGLAPSCPDTEGVPDSAVNRGVGVVDRRSVQGMVGGGSAVEAGKPWRRPQGMLDSTRSEEQPERIHSASGVLVAADPSASEAVKHGMTWCELDPEKIGVSARSSSENVPGAALRQRFPKKQHLAERRKDVRKAGSSGPAGPLNLPCSYDSSLLCLPFRIPRDLKPERQNRQISQQMDMIRELLPWSQGKGYIYRSRS